MLAEFGQARVVIVVPTLGLRVDWLAACLRSIHRQDACKDAVVVVPGPVPPAVAALAKEFDATVVVQTGLGLSAAINQGWRERAHEAEFVTWLGDDDLLADGSLARAVEALQLRPEAVMVYGRLRVIDEESRTLLLIKPGRLAQILMRYGPNLVPQPGSLCRRAAVIDVGMLDESLKEAMDLDLFLKLQRVGRTVYEPCELASFRHHAGSITHIAASRGQESARVKLRYAAFPVWGVTSLAIFNKFWYRLHVVHGFVARRKPAPYYAGDVR